MREIKDDDILYTVAEVAKIMRTNPAYVYELIKANLLPVLKLGSYKVRKDDLLEFLETHVGMDLSNPHQIKQLEVSKGE
ncbi:helix-turn-helix domain-containing protein [Alkalicella caledoniensis]|uniref:Helix-turn-helix domain-containing protein n=1 Tax=Alkalicella caledoniensis TaxID=2731377 RepID=A0A7G9W9F4_ALKCA|nr:helix-turn-helix domain-containing protein [Alkalicella caledoniensis]QNO15316.1 helix-turn-helix domain-containing protein [Alkalicella caledoniensis]